MGQKAKNAGKKQSKTCNKKATSKSICGGGCFREKALTHIQIMELQLMGSKGNSTYVKGVGNVVKSNGTVLKMLSS